MPPNIKEKVSLLEETLNRFILNTDKALYRLSKEMQDFKDEMKDFKDEMRIDRKAMNKKWGDLSNKLGSFAEDIAAPNIPRIAKTYFNTPSILRFSTNLRASPPNEKDKVYEFDALAETANKVFLLETKFTVREKYLDKIPIIIQNFKKCYPELVNKELIVLFASMKLHESTIKRLTKMNIYAMAMGDETMDLLNFKEVQQQQ